MRNVITYQTTAGQDLRICGACERKLERAGLWPRTKYSGYCHVAHGQHYGECDLHESIDAAIAAREVNHYIALTPE